MNTIYKMKKFALLLAVLFLIPSTYGGTNSPTTGPGKDENAQGKECCGSKSPTNPSECNDCISYQI